MKSGILEWLHSACELMNIITFGQSVNASNFTASEYVSLSLEYLMIVMLHQYVYFLKRFLPPYFPVTHFSCLVVHLLTFQFEKHAMKSITL